MNKGYDPNEILLKYGPDGLRQRFDHGHRMTDDEWSAELARVRAETEAEKQANANGGPSSGASTRPPPGKKPKPDWRTKTAIMIEVQKMKFDPITFLVRDLIPNKGVCLICAKPKVGKSWLLLDIAISSTMNRMVLGEIFAVPGEVLLLSLEDSLQRLQSRTEKLLQGFNGTWPDNLTVATQWRRIDEGGLDDIREWAAEKKAAGRKIAFIGIDVLKCVRPPKKPGQGDYDADYDAITGLHHLSVELGVPILVVHHTRKAEADDLIDKVSGSFGLTGAVDTILIIEKQKNGTVFDVRGRDIESNALLVEFNKNSCRWTIIGNAAQVQSDTTRAKIVTILRAAGEPLSPKEVTDQSDMTPENVRQSLLRMWENGEILKKKRGKYTLSECHP